VAGRIFSLSPLSLFLEKKHPENIRRQKIESKKGISFLINNFFGLKFSAKKINFFHILIIFYNNLKLNEKLVNNSKNISSQKLIRFTIMNTKFMLTIEH
jgi:hypothetical protein